MYFRGVGSRGRRSGTIATAAPFRMGGERVARCRCSVFSVVDGGSRVEWPLSWSGFRANICEYGSVCSGTLEFANRKRGDGNYSQCL